jgi:hypothetical protein
MSMALDLRILVLLVSNPSAMELSVVILVGCNCSCLISLRIRRMYRWLDVRRGAGSFCCHVCCRFTCDCMGSDGGGTREVLHAIVERGQ